MCLSCTVLPFWSLPIIANCFSRLQLTSELFFGQFNRNMWEIDTISWYYARTFNWIFLYLLGFSHWIYHLLFFFGVVMYWLFIGDKLSCYLRDLLSIWSEELPEIIGFFFSKIWLRLYIWCQWSDFHHVREVHLIYRFCGRNGIFEASVSDLFEWVDTVTC